MLSASTVKYAPLKLNAPNAHLEWKSRVESVFNVRQVVNNAVGNLVIYAWMDMLY